MLAGSRSSWLPGTRLAGPAGDAAWTTIANATAAAIFMPRSVTRPTTIGAVATESARDWRVRWRLFFSEVIGTAALLLGGLSVVIVMSADGSPVARMLPNDTVRMAVTGFLFGCVGGGIALSRVGTESGAHINPAVTMGFWLLRKLDARTAVGYIVAQLVGAGLGVLPLLAFGPMGASVAFGATIPGEGYATSTVVMGEAVTTFGLIAVLCIFLGFRHLRRFTPFTMPLLYGVMVPLEARISRHQHQSGALVRTGADFRALGWMVDLLAGPDDRDGGGHPRVQRDRHTHRGRKALSLRDRPPAALSPDGRARAMS